MNRWAKLSALFIILTITCIAVALVSMTLGPADISVTQTIQIIISGPQNSQSTHFSPPQHRIIWNLRLPRILTAGVAGMVLAISGMVYQALFRNPMADPYVLGISSGAAFGVSFAAFLGLIGGATGVWQVPSVAFAGSMGAAFLILLLSGGTRRSPVTLLLTGIALNFLLSALMTLFMYLNRTQLHSILQWTMGSFSTSSWQKLTIMTIFSLIGGIPLLFLTKEMDILLLDEASALSVGVSVKAIRMILLICSTLATSVTVSFCGIIGFVGLMVPHIMRLITGPRHTYLMPFCLVGGMLMAIVADTAARTLVGNSELPVGVITSIAGAPLFIIMLIKHRKETHI